MQTTSEPSSQTEAEKSAAMLKLMCDIDAHPIAMAMLAVTRDACGLPPLDSAVLNWLEGPLIVHNLHGWGLETGPFQKPEIKRQIYKERIDVGLGLSPLRVGPAEWMCVAYDAAVGQPCETHFAEVWIWASMQTLVNVNSAVTPEAFWDGLGRSAGRRLTLDDILHDPGYHSIYDGLCSAIIAKTASEETRRRRAGGAPRLRMKHGMEPQTLAAD